MFPSELIVAGFAKRRFYEARLPLSGFGAGSACGGAAMPEAVAQKLKDLFGAPYVEGDGRPETIAATHINPADRPKKQWRELQEREKVV